jgi:hypothetical protein
VCLYFYLSPSLSFHLFFPPFFLHSLPPSFLPSSNLFLSLCLSFPLTHSLLDRLTLPPLLSPPIPCHQLSLFLNVRTSHNVRDTSSVPSVLDSPPTHRGETAHDTSHTQHITVHTRHKHRTSHRNNTHIIQTLYKTHTVHHSNDTNTIPTQYTQITRNAQCVIRTVHDSHTVQDMHTAGHTLCTHSQCNTHTFGTSPSYAPPSFVSSLRDHPFSNSPSSQPPLTSSLPTPLPPSLLSSHPPLPLSLHPYTHSLPLTPFLPPCFLSLSPTITGEQGRYMDSSL